jgi:nucleoid-associated protein YgaU
MNRYLTTPVTKNELTSKRRLSTTIFTAPPANATDIRIRTTSVERLDKLADKFYGDATAWPIIAAANGIGKGTLVVPPDTSLRIPIISDIQNYLNVINNTR